MKKNLRSTYSNRQHMHSKYFEIYYYDDKSLPTFEDHSHNYYEFYFFLGGDVAMHIGREIYPLKYGDVILIPPHIKHHIEVLNPDTQYQRIVFWISREYYNQLMQLSADYGYVMQHVHISKQYIYHYDVIGFNTLQSKVFQLIEELYFQRFGKSAKVALCVNDLILHLNRSIYEMEHPATPREDMSLYRNLVSFIERHLDENLTLDHLAQQFFVSKYHIAHLFKEKLGISVHQYIIKKRLALSRDAILSNHDIGEAFLTCGFKDYSSFYRAFKKEYGVSPKEYRELYARKL